MQKCYLALGCFWKPEETFNHTKGIVDTEVGYAGGDSQKVTYEEICFQIHDPTQKDMQYPDVGTQYRSEIFYNNESQKKLAIEEKKILNKKLNNKIETNISEIKNYCKAEEYHQKYIMKRGR